MGKKEITTHIVKTAGDLFYKNGYNATGINEIIQTAGIAKATLYGHFKSKEDLCVAYLQQRHSFFMIAIINYTKSRPLGKDQLLGIFDFLRDFFREEDFYGCWALKVFNELPPENEKILETVQQQKKELLFFLGELIQDNYPNSSKAEIERISGGLYMLYESAISESHLHKNDWPIHLAKRLATSLIQEVAIFS